MDIMNQNVASVPVDSQSAINYSKTKAPVETIQEQTLASLTKNDSAKEESKQSQKVIAGAQTAGNEESLQASMTSLNEQLQKLQSYLQFERDEDTDKMVFFIKNSETNEVIRQIPSQEFLAISKNITDYIERAQQSAERFVPPVGMITDETV